jgi:hypothetical protein
MDEEFGGRYPGERDLVSAIGLERLKDYYVKYEGGMPPTRGLFFVRVTDKAIHIGYSFDVVERFVQLRSTWGRGSLELLGCIEERYHPRLLRKIVHRHFKRHRISGSHFYAAPELLVFCGVEETGE